MRRFRTHRSGHHFKINPMLKQTTPFSFFLLLLLSVGCSKSENTTSVQETESAMASAVIESSAPDANYNGPAGVPGFPYLDLLGKTMNTANLTGNVTVVFFNPDCDHCQKEAQNINGAKNLFRDKQMYFFSADELEAIKAFRLKYGLVEDNFHFGKGDVEMIVRAMGPINSVPSFYFYKNGQLTGQLEGEKSAAEIAAKM